MSIAGASSQRRANSSRRLRRVTRPAGFLHAGETLVPEALFSYAAEAQAHGTRLVYSDHDSVERTGRHVDPWYVWDWSPDRLLAQDYIGGFYLAQDTKAFRSSALECVTGSPETWRYDLLLHLTDSEEGIRHVPKVLWGAPANRASESAHADAELAVVTTAVSRRGMGAEVETKGTGTSNPLRRLRWPLNSEPRVSIVIPTTGRIDLVCETLEGLRRTDYGDMELIFLDNSRGANWDGIAQLGSEDVTVLERNEPFNWSKLSNDGARAAVVIASLHDDCGGLRSVLAARAGPSGGAARGRCRGAAAAVPGRPHPARGSLPCRSRRRGGSLAPRGRTVATRTSRSIGWLVRRPQSPAPRCWCGDAFESVNGFDEELAVIGNDVDLCLRFRRPAIARSGRRRAFWSTTRAPLALGSRIYRTRLGFGSAGRICSKRAIRSTTRISPRIAPTARSIGPGWRAGSPESSGPG